MDMEFKGPRRQVKKVAQDDTKQLPGFRPESELPDHTLELVNGTNESATVQSPAESEDPTDLTLDREKADIEKQSSTLKKPTTQSMFKKKPTKKQLIILVSLLVIVIIGAFLNIYALRDDTPKTSSQSSSVAEITTEATKPVLVPIPLTGIDASAEVAARPVTAIMIENSLAARPQAGIADADMMFEAIAEGGITRFIGLFQGSMPGSVGPIRSARPYYVDIARTFDAAYVHAGGSPDALERINQLQVKDMSAFESGDTYFRVMFRDAPHDLYSTMEKIDKRRGELGFNSSTFAPWKRKNDTPQTPTASQIQLTLSSSPFNPSFTYDQSSNTYQRQQNGSVHTDDNGKSVSPKVVIAVVTTVGQDGIYSTYRLTGSGEIRVFQDGIVSQGTWSKDSPESPFVLKDKNGLEFSLNKGQTWVTLVGSTNSITYQP